MLKVLHLFNEYLGTTENWAANLIGATPDIDATVAAFRLLPTNFYSPRVTYLQCPLQGPLPNPERQLMRRLYNRVYGSVRRGWPRILAGQAGAPDILHAHFGPVGWLYRRLRADLNCPLVVSFYGNDYGYVLEQNPAWRGRYAALFATADCFVCEGDHGAETLAGLGCPREKIRVLQLGIVPQRIPVQQRPKRQRSLSLLQVAAMTEKKGQIYTIRAFAQASADCPNMTLTLVGSPRRSEDHQRLEAIKGEASALGVADRVKFIAGIDYSRLHEFLADFQVFIHPSVHAVDRDCEGGAPVVLLDAQATGMPVIATTHCDIPSEVVDGQTGMLAPERDVPGLAAAIRCFYAMDQATYDGFAARARAHVEAHYDLAHNAAALRTLYGDVVKRYHGG